MTYTLESTGCDCGVHAGSTGCDCGVHAGSTRCDCGAYAGEHQVWLAACMLVNTKARGTHMHIPTAKISPVS